MSKKDKQVEPAENGNGAAVGGTIPEATNENVPKEPEVSEEAKQLAQEFGKTPEEVQKEIDALLQEPIAKKRGGGRASIEKVPGEVIKLTKGTNGFIAHFEARMSGDRKSLTEPKEFVLGVSGNTVRCSYRDKKGSHEYIKRPADKTEQGWTAFVAEQFVGLKNLPIK
jgi:hypothetical protein